MKKLILIIAGLLYMYSMIYAQEDSKGEFRVLDENINVSNVSFDGKYTVVFTEGGVTKLWSEEEGLVAIDEGQNAGSRSYAVSNDGVVVGEFRDPNYSYIEQGERVYLLSGGYFKNEVWNSLGIKEGLPIVPSIGSNAHAISNDETLIAGSWYSEENHMVPVIWENGVVRELNTDNDYVGNIASMSGDGNIMGGWIQSGTSRYPVIWIDEEIKEIKYESQSCPGEVLKISENGKYAAMYFSLNGSKPALYDIENDEVILIDNPNDLIGFANGVSNDGIVVGYFMGGMWDPDKAFIYTIGKGTQILSDYLELLEIEVPAEISLSRADAISADGLRIVGNANKDGFTPVGFSIDIYEHELGYNSPKNLTAVENAPGSITLSWETAENDGDNVLEGYNVYRNGIKINTSPVTHLEYDDSELDNGTYVYEIKAVWNESEESKPLTLTINTGEVIMPFFDNFDSEDWNYKLWNTDNFISYYWDISLQNGLKYPCLFFNAPKNAQYFEGIVSPYIDATNSSEVYLSFSLARAKSTETNNTLKIEIFDGENWNTAKEYNPSPDESAFKYEKIDISSFAANKQIRVKFTASGNNDNTYIGWNIDNIRVYDLADDFKAEKPLNLNVVKKADGNISISWVDPNETAELSYFAENQYADIVGNEGEPVIFANYFEKEDLAAYEGYKMTSITAFFSTRTPDDLAEYKLVAFDGETRILDQTIDSYTSNSWNTIELENHIIIDSTKPIYFGLEVTYHNPLDLPVGLSGIDEVDGKSNLYSEDGGETWGTLMEFNIKRSLAIKANMVKENGLNKMEGILGYAVFRNGIPLYGEGIVNPLNHYTDKDAPEGENICYEISAFYYIIQEESLKTEEVCISLVSVENSKQDEISVYPNPASDQIYIDGNFEEITLLDITGKTLMNTTKNTVSLNSLPRGLYILKVKTKNDTVLKKIEKQ